MENDSFLRRCSLKFFAPQPSAIPNPTPNPPFPPSDECYLVVHSVVVTTTKQSTSSYQFEDVSVTCKSYFWKGQHTSPKVLMAWKLFFGKMVEERLVQKIGMLPEKVFPSLSQ